MLTNLWNSLLDANHITSEVIVECVRHLTIMKVRKANFGHVWICVLMLEINQCTRWTMHVSLNRHYHDLSMSRVIVSVIFHNFFTKTQTCQSEKIKGIKSKISSLTPFLFHTNEIKFLKEIYDGKFIIQKSHRTSCTIFQHYQPGTIFSLGVQNPLSLFYVHCIKIWQSIIVRCSRKTFWDFFHNILNDHRLNLQVFMNIELSKKMQCINTL